MTIISRQMGEMEEEEEKEADVFKHYCFLMPSQPWPLYQGKWGKKEEEEEEEEVDVFKHYCF